MANAKAEDPVEQGGESPVNEAEGAAYDSMITAGMDSVEEDYSDLDFGDNLDTSDSEAAPENELGTLPEDDGASTGEAEVGDDATGAPEASEGGAESDGEELVAVGEETPSGEGSTDEEALMVPKARFDEQTRQLRSKIADLTDRLNQAGAPSAPSGADTIPDAPDLDLKAQRKEYFTAVEEGDYDKAQEIDESIQQATIAIARREAVIAAQQARDQTSLSDAINDLKTAYPVLDGEAEAFNEATTNEVLGIYQGYLSQNYAPADAMNKAARMVLRDQGLWDDGTANAAPATPAAPPAPGRTPTPEQVARKQQAAAKQVAAPTTSRQVAPEPGEINVFDLSEAAFDSLTDVELAALRGDSM